MIWQWCNSCVLPRGAENLCPHKNLHVDVSSSFIHNYLFGSLAPPLGPFLQAGFQLLLVVSELTCSLSLLCCGILYYLYLSGLLLSFLNTPQNMSCLYQGPRNVILISIKAVSYPYFQMERGSQQYMQNIYYCFVCTIYTQNIYTYVNMYCFALLWPSLPM